MRAVVTHAVIAVAVRAAVVITLLLASAVRVVKQYERGVEKNTTVVFPAPLMSAIGELAAFLARESTAAAAGRSIGDGRAYALTETSPAPAAAPQSETAIEGG